MTSVLKMFRRNHDTMQIAAFYGVTEAEVYSRLGKELDAEYHVRIDREWRRVKASEHEALRHFGLSPEGKILYAGAE